MKKLITIRIEPEIWQEFRRRYEKVGLSSKVRELILRELNGTSNEVLVKKLDWQGLYKIVFADDVPIQVVGNVGVGKSLTMKELIKNDKSHVYIVFDCHDEYKFLPEVQMIPQKIEENIRVLLPKEVPASVAMFSLYSNQILSKRWDPNIVFVIEEAHRFRETKLLLREARKFAKIIAISQEPLVNFCPIIKVVS